MSSGEAPPVAVAEAEPPVLGPFDTGVRLVYALHTLDGVLIEQATEAWPLCFDMGDGSLMPSLEDRLVGLEYGREYQFLLSPGDWQPLPDPANVHWLPRERFTAAMPLAPGQLIEFATEAGETASGRVLAVEDERVQLDFNHPLAGLAVRWTVRVLHPSGPLPELCA